MTTAAANFSARPAFRLELRINQTGTNIEGNYSTWNIALEIIKQQASPTYSFNNSSWGVNVNGTYWGGNFTFDFRNSDRLLLFATDINVPHDSDGSKSFSGSGSVNAAVLGSAGVSMGLYPSQIPRATQPSLTQSTADAGSQIGVYLPRASDSFVHSIQIFFGNYGKTLLDNATTGANIIIPMETLNEIPNNASGTGVIRAVTFQNGNLIGYKDTGITVTAGANIIPQYDAVTATEATPGLAANIGAYVKNLTTLALAITNPRGMYGASITSYKITVAGQTINSQTGTTAPIAQSGTLTVTATVTDSRGRYTTKTINVTVLDYAPPKFISVSYQRALSTGVVNDQGTYIKLFLNASVSSLMGGGTQRNALKIQLFYRLRGASTWTAQAAAFPGGISYNSSALMTGQFSVEQAFEIRVDISDDFMTSTTTLTVPTADIFMHWNGRLGVGIGKFHQQGSLDVLGDIYHRDGNMVEPAGLIVPFAGSVAPAGWLIANGALVSRTTYYRLFGVFGTRYGAGDGTNTFALPDLKGRIPVGVDTAQSEFTPLGLVGGAKTHTLTTDQMPSHTHLYSTNAANAQFTTGGGTGMDIRQTNNATSSPTGGGQAHNNLQPYIALHYLIKT